MITTTTGQFECIRLIAKVKCGYDENLRTLLALGRAQSTWLLRSAATCRSVEPGESKTLGLYTGDVDMLPSPTLPRGIVDARCAFANRKHPVGAFVTHPVHGTGVVLETCGLQRNVEFESPHLKSVSDLPPPPDDGHGQLHSLFTWHDMSEEWVHVTELTGAGLRPVPTSLRVL